MLQSLRPFLTKILNPIARNLNKLKHKPEYCNSNIPICCSCCSLWIRKSSVNLRNISYIIFRTFGCC